MNEKIVVRFSELTLKGKNRMMFVKKLLNNFLFKVDEELELQLEVKKDFDKFEIVVPIKEIPKVEDILKNLIGASSYSLVKEFKDYQSLEKELIKMANTLTGTFKVFPKTRQKGLVQSSDTFKRQVAKSILDNSDLKVNITNPDHKIVIESYEKTMWLHYKNVKLPEGLPVGSNGKSLSLLSGGFDSPVASYLMMKRGMDVDYISFLTPPHTSEKTEEKIISIAKELNKFSGRQQRLYIVNYTEIQNELAHITDERYRIVLMRRSFMRIASHLLKQYKYDNLLTGDNLGQVASQTIDGLKVTTLATEELILRPLITYSKNEIMNVAKQIGTHDLSIIKADDTCSMFVPNKPTTKPNLEKTIKLEEELMVLNELENNVIINNIRIIKI